MKVQSTHTVELAVPVPFGVTVTNSVDGNRKVARLSIHANSTVSPEDAARKIRHLIDRIADQLVQSS